MTTNRNLREIEINKGLYCILFLVPVKSSTLTLNCKVRYGITVRSCQMGANTHLQFKKRIEKSTFALRLSVEFDSTGLEQKCHLCALNTHTHLYPAVRTHLQVRPPIHVLHAVEPWYVWRRNMPGARIHCGKEEWGVGKRGRGPASHRHHIQGVGGNALGELCLHFHHLSTHYVSLLIAVCFTECISLLIT